MREMNAAGRWNGSGTQDCKRKESSTHSSSTCGTAIKLKLTICVEAPSASLGTVLLSAVVALLSIVVVVVPPPAPLLLPVLPVLPPLLHLLPLGVLQQHHLGLVRGLRREVREL